MKSQHLIANTLPHTPFRRSADWEGNLGTATTGHDHREAEGRPRALWSELQIQVGPREAPPRPHRYSAGPWGALAGARTDLYQVTGRTARGFPTEAVTSRAAQ